MRVQIIVFLAYTVSSTLSFAADDPGYVGNRFPGVVEPLIEWRKTRFSELPYNQHVRKQRRLRISIQHGIRPSNRHPSSLCSTCRSQFADQPQVPAFVIAQSSQSTKAPKDVVEFQQAIGTPQQLDFTKSTDELAEIDKMKIRSPDTAGLQQTVEQLQGDLARSNAKIAELEQAKSEFRDVAGLQQKMVEKLQADLLESADQVVDLEKAKAQLELSVKQAEQARDTAENDKHQTEQVSNEKSTKLQMAYTQQQTDKDAVYAISRAWEFLAYVAIACFVTFVGWSLRRI
jgi:hypothetical protein